MQNQRFGVGDIAKLITTDNEWLVKIILPIQEDDGSWWYEVECIDERVSENIRKKFHREVPQNRLQEV